MFHEDVVPEERHFVYFAGVVGIVSGLGGALLVVGGLVGGMASVYVVAGVAAALVGGLFLVGSVYVARRRSTKAWLLLVVLFGLQFFVGVVNVNPVSIGIGVAGFFLGRRAAETAEYDVTVFGIGD